MRRKILTSGNSPKGSRNTLCGWIAILLMTALFCSSCLKDDDDNNVTYYSDTAITAFALSSFNRTVHTTTAAGKDSTYVVQIAGSGYKFYIDQQKQIIYNPDSLPAGSDAAHVICTITSKNSGIIMLKSLTSDSLAIYSATDSINFSQPRILRVYSNDGSSSRDYTVKVNVHQEEAEEFNWNLLMSDEENLAQTSCLRLAALGDRCFAFGLADDGKSTFMMDLQQRADGMEDYFALSFEGDVTGRIASSGKELLILEGTTLHRYTLSETGALTASTDNDRNVGNIAQLLAADDKCIYARATNGDLLVSTDYCQTWTKEGTDHDNSLLPTENLSSIIVPSTTNADIHRLLLIGNREEGAFPADATAQIWGKSIEPGVTGEEWYYINENDCSFPLPRMRSLSAIHYDTLILAVGAAGFGGSSVSAFTKFFVSQDGGINWRGNSLYSFPKGFSSNNVFAMTVDSENRIWMACGESGQIWRGRMNRLGWETEQKAFTK